MEKKITVDTGDFERIPVNFNGKTYIIRVGKLTEEIDIDELLKIHYDNIIGELITFPLVINKIGLLKNDIQEELKNAEFDLKVFYAQKYEEVQKSFIGSEKKATDKAIESTIYRDSNYIAKQKLVFKYEKLFNYFDTIFWQMKNKSDKLDTLSTKIVPSEFENEILAGSINGVLIKIAKNTF